MRWHLAAAAILLSSACGGDGGSAEATLPACEVPSPASAAEAVPDGLRLDEHATITEVTRHDRALGVVAVSDLTVVELYPPLARAILDSGYSIVSSDNEGFEAEIFFGDDHTTGAYRLREAPCKEQVIVRLLFEQDRGREKQ